MDFDQAEFARILEHEHKKTLGIQGRRMLREARAEIDAVRELVESVEVRRDTFLDNLDQIFAPTGTFDPSTMVRTQLRLALRYLDDANGRDLVPSPTLSSYVLLRVAIESAATAHWLLSAKDRRTGVERMLKRMWWDTFSAYEMALSADETTPRSQIDGVEQLIRRIAGPVKGVDADRIIESKRISLSSIVQEASADFRPDYPGGMLASWQLCAGVSHGNIPISAGAGMAPETIQDPSLHLLDTGDYGHVLTMVIDDVRRAAQLFERRATTPLAHRPPTKPTSPAT